MAKSTKMPTKQPKAASLWALAFSVAAIDVYRSYVGPLNSRGSLLLFLVCRPQFKAGVRGDGGRQDGCLCTEPEKGSGKCFVFEKKRGKREDVHERR